MPKDGGTVRSTLTVLAHRKVGRDASHAAPTVVAPAPLKSLTVSVITLASFALTHYTVMVNRILFTAPSTSTALL